eukprot:4925-Chlamydomonas_euryale.AAC.4
MRPYAVQLQLHLWRPGTSLAQQNHGGCTRDGPPHSLARSQTQPAFFNAGRAQTDAEAVAFLDQSVNYERDMRARTGMSLVADTGAAPSAVARVLFEPDLPAELCHGML